MSQEHVLVTRPIPGSGPDRLRAAGLEVRQWQREDPMPRADLVSAIADIEGLLCTGADRVDEELLARAGQLRAVANYAVGYDNIDLAACTRRGVLVSNTPGVLAETTADLTWALILAVARRLVEGVDYVRAGRWKTWSPTLLLGGDVHGRTLGILGMGETGWQVARRAAGFDMRVLYHGRNRKPELESQMAMQYVPFEHLLSESDVLTVHVSLSEETRGMIGASEIALMKPTAYLVNAARGPIVDTRAVYEACRDGRLAGAALDVTDPEPLPADHPLLTLPNVVVVPHIGSATRATRERMGEVAADNLLAALAGRRPPNLLNPEAFSG